MNTALRGVVAPPVNNLVKEVISAHPAAVQKQMLRLRELIFRVARKTEGVGELTETLRWGEPAYRTEQTRSGSPVRLGYKASEPDRVALHFICTTSLVGSFRRRFSDKLRFEGNRSVVFRVGERLPVRAIEACLAEALTYHRK